MNLKTKLELDSQAYEWIHMYKVIDNELDGVEFRRCLTTWKLEVLESVSNLSKDSIAYISTKLRQEDEKVYLIFRELICDYQVEDEKSTNLNKFKSLVSQIKYNFEGEKNEEICTDSRIWNR